MLFDPLTQNPAVKVVASMDRAIYTVSWAAQVGANGYKVFAGFDPVHIRSLISGSAALPADTLSYVFNAPTYPPNQILYFWVQSVYGSSSSFIDEYGSYTLSSSETGSFSPNPLNQTSQAMMEGDDQQYFLEEMRRRAAAILQDTGEDVIVFMRQWRGLPDPSTQTLMAEDPDYQGMTRDDRTFGTGFYPGFFPSIKIKMRFGALPAAMLDMQMPGFRPLLANEAWTNWDPILHENDLIVRVSTGVRYVPTSVAYSNYRGIPITQRMQLQELSFNNQLYKVTDPLLAQRWAQVNAADYARAGFSVAADALGGPDYLLFR